LFSSSGKKEIINLRKGKPKYQLIFFYESGCAHCEEAIALLTENYQRLTQKGIDVIAVSSDMLTENFLKTAEKFPWKTRICDYKGIQGDNFKNYGVYGTPMFFVVNKTGKIVLKPITATEFIQWAESGALNQPIKSR
jgi:peroxiredoxin